MRVIFAAALLLLLISSLVQLRRPAAEGEHRSLIAEPSIVLLAALGGIVLAVSISRMFLDRYVIFDDAYMSYRYAKHLAFGHGLVWNIGEPPVEGYSNFLLVVVLSPFIRLGADPLTVTRILSTLAALGLGFVVFRRSRRTYRVPTASAITLAYLGSNFAFSLVMVGLETVLFACALFLGYDLGTEYLKTRRPRTLWLSAAILFIAILLRPEAGLLVVLLSLVAAPADLREGRAQQHLKAVLLGFWLPLAVYLSWKVSYFGALLPNPAHIKLASGGFIVPRGAETVANFLSTHSKLLTLSLLSLPLVRGRDLGRVLAAALVCSYAAFYVHVDTLMDIYNRFLFPAAPFLFELAVPAIAFGFSCFDRLHIRILREIALFLSVILAVLPGSDDFKDVHRSLLGDFNFAPHPRTEPAENGHSRHMLEAGRALAAYPGISQVTLAAVDAGALPYVSDVKDIDLVGLNDRFIAREKNVSRLLGYVFGKRPEIFLHRDRLDGSLITYGHGTLGDHRLWAEDPGWDDYSYAGTLVDVEPWRHELHVFVRKSAPESLRSFVRRRFVDFVHERPPVYGSERKKVGLTATEAASIPLPEASRARFPVSIAATRDHLVDASGAPFLIRGDAGWSSGRELKREDFLTYLSDRKFRGFNAFLFSVADHTKEREGAPNAYGEKPFLVPGDFSTPNERYFRNVDSLLNDAEQAGFLVFVTPAYLGYLGGDQGWYTNIVRNGPEKMRQYGRYVATRWQSLSNIVWVEGGDFTPPPDGLRLVDAVAQGIKDVDTKHLHTAHFGPETSAGDLAPAWLDIDTTYSYEPVYLKLARDRAANHGVRPFVLIESTYENEHDSRPLLIRSQAYQAMLGGACGQFFGNNPVWNFAKGWQSALDSPGSRAMTHLFALFEGRPWWQLTPEPSSATLIGGQGDFGSRDWASVARTPDGRLVIIYLPSARPIAVDLSRLAGKVRARWYDPTSGQFRIAAEGVFDQSRLRAFTPPGPNQAGDGDWVLLLETLSATP